MDWNALLSTIAIIVFVVLMLRGCGGMMAGGGCGMDMRRRPKRGEKQGSEGDASRPASTR